MTLDRIRAGIQEMVRRHPDLDGIVTKHDLDAACLDVEEAVDDEGILGRYFDQALTEKQAADAIGIDRRSFRALINAPCGRCPHLGPDHSRDSGALQPCVNECGCSGYVMALAAAYASEDQPCWYESGSDDD